MRLSAKVIKNYANINNFDYGSEWTHRAGDPNTLYFQLVDLDKTDDKNTLRYMAGIGGSNQPASVSVIFPSIDDSAQLTIAATQVDAADSSIWKVVLTPSQVPGSGAVQFAVTESTTIRKFSVMALMSVEYPDSDGSC
jgi:hypothetical protein